MGGSIYSSCNPALKAVLKTTLRHHLERIYTERELSAWFDPLNFHEDRNNHVVRVAFPHALFGQWFMRTVRNGFETHALDLIGDPLVYEYPPRPERQRPENSLETTTALQRRNDCQQAEYSALKGKSLQQPLPEHTFATFLVNKKNDFPLAAARDAVAGADNHGYSPFIVYGQSGCGKTHLLEAMVNALNSSCPQISLLYGGSQLIRRLQPELLATGQAIFLDDLQTISSSAALQKKLIMLLDNLKNTQGFLACTLDSHPAQCPELLPRLISRLSAGLILELKKPDLDIRRQYIQMKNKKLSLQLSKEQTLSLAQRHNDFRTMDGILARIKAYRSAMSGSPDQDTILEKAIERKSPSPADIISVTAGHYQLSADLLTGRSRKKTLILPRQVSMLLTQELLGISLVSLGRIFGGRDHSSILYSLKRIKQLEKENKDMHKTITSLKHLCLSRT
jgi:chromosomal replication initiator protein